MLSTLPRYLVVVSFIFLSITSQAFVLEKLMYYFVQNESRGAVPQGLVNLYDDFEEREISEAAKERFQALEEESRRSRSGGGVFQFAYLRNVNLAVGAISYFPIAHTRAGQIRIAHDNVLKRRKKIFERGGVVFDPDLEINVPRYDDGRSVLSKKDAVSGVLAKDQRTGAEFIILDDGNHRNYASLLSAGASTLPVRIVADYRHLSLDEVRERGLVEGFAYLFNKGGETSIDHFPMPYELENDKVRFLVSLLTAKFEVGVNRFGFTTLVSKAASGPKVFVKIKVKGSPEIQTVPFTEFKLADHIYAGLEEFLASKSTEKREIGKQWKTILELNPSRKNLPIIANTVGAILNHRILTNRFNAESLNIHFLSHGEFIGDPIEEYQRWVDQIKKRVLKSVKDLRKNGSEADGARARNWLPVLKKSMSRKSWASLSRTLQEISEYRPESTEYRGEYLLTEEDRNEIRDSPIESFVSYERFVQWYKSSQKELQAVVEGLVDRLPEFQALEKGPAKAVLRWQKVLGQQLTAKNYPAVLHSVVELYEHRDIHFDRETTDKVTRLIDSAPFNNALLADNIAQRFSWVQSLMAKADKTLWRNNALNFDGLPDMDHLERSHGLRCATSVATGGGM